MASWEGLVYFAQLAPPNEAVIEAQLDSDAGSPDGAAVCYAQTPETLAEEGAFISVIMPFRGPEVWVGLSSLDNPACSGSSPCLYAHAFEAGIHFDGTDFQVQKNGTNQGSSYAYAANGVFKFLRVDDTTIEVYYGAILQATLTYGSALPPLRLAVVAGATFLDDEDPENIVTLQPEVRLHLYEPGEEGGGGGGGEEGDPLRLLRLGHFAPVIDHGFLRLHHKTKPRRRRTTLVGHTEGTRSVKLVYQIMPQRGAGLLDPELDDVVSEFDYLWDFFGRRQLDGLPFLVTDLLTGEDLEVRFVAQEMNAQLFLHALYSTGLELIEHRVAVLA
jgi:hypothetical protein